MADKANKLPENVEGAWYVDNTCTPCRVCLDEAPNLLKYNDDETYVYFYKQPENDDETAAAQRAMDVCPTLAIGIDGHRSPLQKKENLWRLKLHLPLQNRPHPTRGRILSPESSPSTAVSAAKAR